MTFIAIVFVLISTARGAAPAESPVRPKAAVFPLGGSAPAEQREKVGFSLRAKLDRDGTYDPIDGPTMIELANGQAIDLNTAVQTLTDLSKEEAPAVLIWGELDGDASAPMLKLHTLDLRIKDAKPSFFERQIKQPTDMRFVVEEVLKSVPGVKEFQHPVEDSIQDDAQSKAAWAANPNLLTNGDFTDGGKGWRALLRSEVYEPPVSADLPATDKVVVWNQGGKREIGEGVQISKGNVLAMKLSRDVAESNGLACLSAAVPIKPNRRYRIQYEYLSEGPNLHIFVKGYVKGKDLANQDADIQCYECQVPPSGSTGGKWKTIRCDINPQSPGSPPEFLKVDLYTYLSPGKVMFRNVQLKEVGEPTRKATDDAMKNLPTTRP